jgi:hypothetical protein
MDTDGQMHAEKELSAEQLIRRWQETQERPQGGRTPTQQTDSRRKP